MRLKLLLQSVLLAVILTNCSVGPPYTSPCLNISSQWKHEDGNACTSFETDGENHFVYLDNWWDVFEDCRLNELESLAVENNRNLFVAYERVQEYRALMGIAASDFYPQITLNPAYTSTGELIKNYINPNNPNNLTVTQPFRAHELFFALPVNVNYEVDLWGKVRDQYDFAKYSWQAQEMDYEAAMLSLTSSLATVYFQLRALDSQIDLLQGIVQTRQKALEINEDRYMGKIIFYADVTLAAEEVESALLQYHEAIRLREILENQLAVLIGVPASEFCMEHHPLDELPPCIPAGIPSEILLRRPDLAAAEWKTFATHAMVKQAYSQFFPSLILTATGGYESPVFKDFLQWISRFWMFGAQLNQTVFDGMRTSSNVDMQKAKFLQATGDYQQLVLQSFQEIENALVSLEMYQREYVNASAAAEWAKKTNEIFIDRYELGVTYYIDVVNTERDLLNYLITLNSIRGYRYVATIQLIRALGGGWDCITNDDHRG